MPEMRTPAHGRRVAEQIGCAEHVQFIPGDARFQHLLWRASQRARELDLNEHSPESRIIRHLAHAAWRDAFVDGAAT